MMLSYDRFDLPGWTRTNPRDHLHFRKCHRALDTFMSDKALPIKPHEFDSLLAGFEYEHEISEVSNTIAFDKRVGDRDLRRCVVCGRRAAGGPHPGVTRAML
jgi:hypothetical protein